VNLSQPQERLVADSLQSSSSSGSLMFGFQQTQNRTTGTCNKLNANHSTRHQTTSKDFD